jgi:hypothetical protein
MLPFDVDDPSGSCLPCGQKGNGTVGRHPAVTPSSVEPVAKVPSVKGLDPSETGPLRLDAGRMGI